jgi:Na+-transporting NADH:ubiquinone oxidoreductase subunit A
MRTHHLQRGLDLPLPGRPDSVVDQGPGLAHVGVLAADWPGLKARVLVQEGQVVRAGEPLVSDRRWPELCVTAPRAGRIEAVHRGEKRSLRSIVIASEGDAAARFEPLPQGRSPGDVRALLLRSGLWTSLRERPFGRIARPSDTPHAIFVTAIDTQPLAPPVATLLDAREDDLGRAIRALSTLTSGPIYLCSDASIADRLERLSTAARIEVFVGPHPAGNVGVHIHWLEPVDREHIVWHLGLQDALAIGALLDRGRLDTSRIVSLAGPEALRPRLLKTTQGASIDALVAGEVRAGVRVRVVSGSLLSGRAATGAEEGYLGRYHQQVSILGEVEKRHFLRWLAPGARRFSSLPIFLSRWLPRGECEFDTDENGSLRAIVPIGQYERVTPMQLLPEILTRALASGQIEQLEALGALELDEEDVSLWTFVCPSKLDYGALLRQALARLEAEG